MPGVQELTPQTLNDQLQRVTLALGRKYADRASAEDVRREVDQEAAHYRDAHVTQYIPVLVQHAVQERIRHLPRRTPVALGTEVPASSDSSSGPRGHVVPTSRSPARRQELPR